MTARRGICTPSDDVCLAHSLPLVTPTRCAEGERWHALASRLKQRVAKRLWSTAMTRALAMREVNACIDEWARKESRR